MQIVTTIPGAYIAAVIVAFFFLNAVGLRLFLNRLDDLLFHASKARDHARATVDQTLLGPVHLNEIVRTTLRIEQVVDELKRKVEGWEAEYNRENRENGKKGKI